MTHQVDSGARAPAITEGLKLSTGQDYWSTTASNLFGLRSLRMADGPHGLRVQDDETPDHLGLERSVPATCFPPAVTLASSWDEDLIERVGAALGAEARAQGVDILLGPGLNLKRSPLCGRNFEYYSEDPVLSGTLAGAAARGIQSVGVAACLKHFLANNQETDRHRVSAEIDERTLREVYLKTFSIAFETSRAWAVMTSYNRLNGVPVSEDYRLLTNVLRDVWELDAVTISDWGGVYDPVAAFNAGVDIRMPGCPADERIRDAHWERRISDARVEALISRMKTLAARTAPKGEVPNPDFEAHDALVRRAAADSAVLLKNDGGILPFTPRRGQRIAVIGELARTPRYQGAGSSRVNPVRVSNLLDEMGALCSEAGAELAFAEGYTLAEEDPQADLILRAREVTQQADLVILMLGLPDTAEAEGRDRRDIDLPEQQRALLEALSDLSAPRVVAMANGAVVRTNPWRDSVSAIVEFWLTGQAHGQAVTDVLTGVTAPGGRLAETVPLRLEDTPSFLDFPGDHHVVRYSEGIHVGYRWYDARSIGVDYPFGYGLSYTRFDWSDIDVTVNRSTSKVAFTVSVTVRNVGDRAGSDVVQLYTHVPEIFRVPERELSGWAKVHLDPGESTRVEIPVTRRRLMHWHEGEEQWVFSGGLVGVFLGASSRDLRLSRTVEVPGTPVKVALGKWSSLGEWLDHPVMGRRLLAMIGENGGLQGRVADLMSDPVGRESVRDSPLASIAEFPGVPLTPPDLDRLCAEAMVLG